MSAPSSNDLAQLRAEAAAATTAAAVRRLFRRSDQIRKRAAIESLSPDLLSDDELREFASDFDIEVRRALIRNERLDGERLALVTTWTLRHSDNPDQIADWIHYLWDARPERSDVIRGTLRRAARRELDLPGSLAFDIAHVLIRLDESLSADELVQLVELTGRDDSAITAALEHPAAGPVLWDLALRQVHLTLIPLTARSLMVALVSTRAAQYPSVREAACASKDEEVLFAFAPHVSGTTEALALLEQARQVGADEMRLAAALPPATVTPEVQALLLSHPDGDMRLERIATLSTARTARTR